MDSSNSGVAPLQASMAREAQIVQHLSRAFDTLQQILFNLKDLPLAITGVKCVSAYYRGTKPVPLNGIGVKYTDKDFVIDDIARPQYSGRIPPFLPTIRVLITLQQGGKWGNDLTVIAKLKSAFYIDISSRLKADHKLLSVPQEDQILVVFIVLPREITLLIDETSSNSAGAKKSLQKHSAIILKRKFIHKPLITQQLCGLLRRYPSFADSCKLVRKWLAYSLLSKMFDGIAVELLVASVFLNEAAAPKTALAGFIRFIEFLSTFDFAANAVAVDINSSLMPGDLDKAREEFVRNRPALPPLVIITPEDFTGTMFTSVRPEPVIFVRAIKLANVTYSRLMGKLEKLNEVSYEVPKIDLAVYDLTIYVERRYFNEKTRSIPKGKRKFDEPRQRAYLPVVDLSPTNEYVKLLRENFDSIALFFYNAYNPFVIGVLFRPNFRTPRDPNVITGCHNRIKSNDKLLPDIDALIEDFRLLGGELITKIEF